MIYRTFSWFELNKVKLQNTLMRSLFKQSDKVWIVNSLSPYNSLLNSYNNVSFRERREICLMLSTNFIKFISNDEMTNHRVKIFYEAGHLKQSGNT